VGATYSHDTINSMPSEDGRMQLTTKLDKMILDPYELLGHYAGVRPATKDRMPVLGAHKDHENLFIFNGLGSKGVVYAPYCAKVLVESLLFSNELLPELLNFRRFTHLPQKTTN
jgi:glycine/D-amino acid oxidase-like deaminating enzyme